MIKTSKKAKSKNRTKIKLLTIFSLVFLVFVSSGYAILKINIDIVTVATINQKELEENDDFEIIDNWYNDFRKYYHIKINIKNDQAVETIGWEVTFDIPSDVEMIESPNALVEISNGKVVLKNKDYNSVIQPNNNIDFSIIFKTIDEDYVPTNFNKELFFLEDTIIDDKDDEILSGSLKKEITLKNNWGGKEEGYIMQYELKLTNQSDTTIKNWSIELIDSSKFEIINIWNGNYIIKDNIVTITPMDYNDSISAYESMEIGFQIKSDIYLYKPEFKVLETYDNTSLTSNNEVQIYSQEYDFKNIDIEFNKKNTWSEDEFFVSEYEVYVKNNTLTNINKFQMEINEIEGIKIKSIWNANYIITSEKLTILCSDIEVKDGDFYSFGIQIASKDKDYIPKVSYKISSN